jgi:hypothetical protein
VWWQGHWWTWVSTTDATDWRRGWWAWGHFDMWSDESDDGHLSDYTNLKRAIDDITAEEPLDQKRKKTK